MPGIDAKVAALRDPASYPERPATIEVVETHMSWVFLTPREAWKLKKPVRTGYLDFSTLEARRRNCHEEVRLNRRLAPDVYLGVAPLSRASCGSLGLERPGEVVDWLVRMRRLPAERMLDRLIRDGRLADADVERVAGLLARFYPSCPVIPMRGPQYRARLERKIRENHAVLADPHYGLSRPCLRTIATALERFLAESAALIEARADGRIVEGHGDLRPEHICLEQTPVIFDCLEFNRDFRIVDVADELAFLDMECERIGSATAGAILLRAWREASGDDPSAALQAFYKVVSACLRAKLAVWHIHDVDGVRHAFWLDHAAGYLDIAARYATTLR
jgi:uncharacterized protein